MVPAKHEHAEVSPFRPLAQGGSSGVPVSRAMVWSQTRCKRAAAAPASPPGPSPDRPTERACHRAHYTTPAVAEYVPLHGLGPGIRRRLLVRVCCRSSRGRRTFAARSVGRSVLDSEPPKREKNQHANYTDLLTSNTHLYGIVDEMGWEWGTRLLSSEPSLLLSSCLGLPSGENASQGRQQLLFPNPLPIPLETYVLSLL